MKYTLTGNFQYDLGVYGLKKILDFFEEDYQTDGVFYIETDKKPEEILELIFLYRFYQQKEKFKELFDKVNININALSKFKNFNQLEQSISSFQKIKAEFFRTLALSFQNEFLNLINPSKLKDIQSFAHICNIILENVNSYYKERNTCSFCNKNDGTGINKMYFLFAPSQLNAFWMNNPSIFACKNCSIITMAFVGGVVYTKDKYGNLNLKNALAIYKPNLEALETLNNGLDTTFEKIIEKIIEYEKFNLQVNASVKDFQVIEFIFDSKNPYLEIYSITEDSATNILTIGSQVEKLYKDYKDSLWGQIKSKNGYETIDISKELLKYLTQNQKLIFLVLRFAKLGIMAENFRQNNVRNPPVKGFYISVLLEILNMHFILEELGMDYFNAFKEYGQFLRARVIAQLSERGNINRNTFNNKIIALSNSFLDASKGNFQQFMETLIRVMISYDAPIDSNLLQMIDKNTYKEIATTIALALMTKKPNEEKIKGKEEAEVKNGEEL